LAQTEGQFFTKGCDTYNNSLHFQLSIHLAALGTTLSLVAQHVRTASYAFIGQDFTTQASLYTHHQYIAGFLMVGAFARNFWVRDYDSEQNKATCAGPSAEATIISHLSWVSLILYPGLVRPQRCSGCLGTPEKQILIEPVFAQFVQGAHGKVLYGFNTLLSNPDSIASHRWRCLVAWLDRCHQQWHQLSVLDDWPGDFLVHHAFALGIHTTVLILVKGALDARGSSDAG